MEIKVNREGSALTLALDGRFDTSTAFQVEEVIKQNIDGVTSLVFDCKELEYLSSAGLRVLLGTQRTMSLRGGEMMLINVNQYVRDVFVLTRMLDIFTVVS